MTHNSNPCSTIIAIAFTSDPSSSNLPSATNNSHANTPRNNSHPSLVPMHNWHSCVRHCTMDDWSAEKLPWWIIYRLFLLFMAMTLWMRRWFVFHCCRRNGYFNVSRVNGMFRMRNDFDVISQIIRGWKRFYLSRLQMSMVGSMHCLRSFILS
jgi:hypothetical protein